MMGGFFGDNNNEDDGDFENFSDKNTYFYRNNISKTKGVVGLYNLGNTCYMNSLLQCLKNLYPLTNFVLTNKFDSGKLIVEYKNLLCNLISTKNEIVDAREYHKALKHIDSYYDTYEQRDSSKLFLTHIKALIDDTREFKEENISSKIEKDEPDLYKRYKKSKERNPSKIYDLFFGFLKIINLCKKCGKNNIRYQPYSLIDLDLKNEFGAKITDLEELIKFYEKLKKTDLICKCGSPIFMKTFLGRIPPILVFKFQRSVDNKHINHKINYPNILPMKDYSDGFLTDENNKNNKDLLFKLSGVMLHYGSANSGHKTSFSKNFLDDKWYFFNDSIKSIESESNVLDDKEAFMIFYISNSLTISKERKEKIIRIADDKAKKCDYRSDRYSFLYRNPYPYKNYSQNNWKNDNFFEDKSSSYIDNYHQNNNYNININNITNSTDNLDYNSESKNNPIKDVFKNTNGNTIDNYHNTNNINSIGDDDNHNLNKSMKNNNNNINVMDSKSQ